MAGPERILETELAHAAAPPPLARRFTAGALISRTLSAWWRHAGAFTLMSVVVYAPLSAAMGVAFGAAVSAQPASPPGPAFLAKAGAGLGAAWVLTVALAVVQAGAVTYATVRHLKGERARAGEMLGAGLRRLLPVLATALLVWLAVAGATLLLVVPGVVLLVATSVAIPAAVVERPGAVAAFRRSLALTRGHRWPLFAAGLAVLCVVWVLGAAVQVGVVVAASLLLPRGQALAGTLLASQLANALFSAIPLVGMAVAYHDLRVAREGVDTEALSRVFE